MKFKFITPEDHEYPKARMLRWELLLKPQGLPPGMEAIPKEETFKHLVALDKHQVIGCLVFHSIEEGVGCIEQMAISEEYRGRGFGRKFMHMIEEEALKQGIREIRIEAGEDVISFYEALGYKEDEETFTKFGMLYRILKKRFDTLPQAANI